MTPSTDPELIRRCADGDESAWAALTQRYADVVYGVARRSGLAAADAGDVVQEVFLALLTNLTRLERQDRLLAWILTTARREAWRQVRRRRGTERRDRDASRKDGQEPLAEAALLALEREQVVREAFGEISERCRRLLDALFFAADVRPYADIAERLGIPVGSIGPTRRRCLERLRRALEERGFGPPDVSGPDPSASRGVTRRSP